MTVADQIAHLQALPAKFQSMPVYRDDHEWGPRPIRTVAPVSPKPNYFTGEPYQPGIVII